MSIRPSGPIATLPLAQLRPAHGVLELLRCCRRSGSASHQWVSVLTKVRAVGPRAGRAGCAARVIGSVGQSSPGGRGTVEERVASVPWLNQSRVSNCSHAAASTLSVGAGIISGPRASSRVLTSRGLGVRTRSGSSGSVSASGTLRPNRVFAMPMAGADRSLYDPSTERATT